MQEREAEESIGVGDAAAAAAVVAEDEAMSKNKVQKLVIKQGKGGGKSKRYGRRRE